MTAAPTNTMPNRTTATVVAPLAETTGRNTRTSLAHAPPQPLPARPHKTPKVALLCAAAACVVLLLGAALVWNATSASHTDETHDPSYTSGRLARRIALWSEKADKAQRSMSVDSAAILAHPEYRSAAELKALLDEHTAKPAENLVVELDGLEQELASLIAIHNERADQLHQQRVKAASSGADSPAQLDAAIHDLEEEQSKLTALDRRMHLLRRASRSSSHGHDAEATKELATLRAMEKAVDGNERIDVSADTLHRVRELSSAQNDDLAFLACSVLARSGSPSDAEAVVERLDDFSADRQAGLCISLLISKQPASIAAAGRFLETNAEAAAHLDLPIALAVLEHEGSLSAPMIPALVARANKPDTRLAVARLQVQVLDERWTKDLEKACDTGLLKNKVEDVVADIVSHRNTKAYPLAERLIAEHVQLPFSNVSDSDVEAVGDEQPKLGSMVVEQWLFRGDDKHRAAALELWNTDRVKLDAAALATRVKKDAPSKPMSLVNVLLRSGDPATLALAEAVLADGRNLSPDELDYEHVSKAALDAPKLRSYVLKMSWQGSAAARSWALLALLGPDFEKMFFEAEGRRFAQDETISKITNVLNGKVVALAQNTYAKDKSLQIKTRDVPKLPSDIDPQRWGPESDAQRSLASLRETLSATRATCDEPFSASLDQIGTFLETLQTASDITYRLATVYDATVTKQLPGLKRELLTRKIDTWDFRFVKVNLDTFEDLRGRWPGVKKTLDEQEPQLPIRPLLQP